MAGWLVPFSRTKKDVANNISGWPISAKSTSFCWKRPLSCHARKNAAIPAFVYYYTTVPTVCICRFLGRVSWDITLRTINVAVPGLLDVPIISGKKSVNRKITWSFSGSHLFVILFLSFLWALSECCAPIDDRFWDSTYKILRKMSFRMIPVVAARSAPKNQHVLVLSEDNLLDRLQVA